MDKNTHTKGMLKEESFRDRTIIITGGATGLGKSMATYLSGLGANIVICSRKEDNLLKSAEYIMEETGNTVLPVVCDVRDTVQIQNVIDESFKKFNGIDCLVNNAAGNFISPTERLSPKGFDKFGNYTFGIKEHIIFPEVNFDKVDKIRGLDITIVISSLNEKHSYELLKKLNFPFKNERNN